MNWQHSNVTVKSKLIIQIQKITYIYSTAVVFSLWVAVPKCKVTVLKGGHQLLLLEITLLVSKHCYV